MVVSSVGVGAPPCTTLPAVTSARLMRPLIGARTWVQSRLSFAVRTAASAPWMAASASALPLTRASYSSREIAFSATSGLGALGLAAGQLAPGSSRGSSSAWARSSASLYSRWSMTKSTSPCLTSLPSVNVTFSMKPETRGRTST